MYVHIESAQNRHNLFLLMGTGHLGSAESARKKFHLKIFISLCDFYLSSFVHSFEAHKMSRNMLSCGRKRQLIKIICRFVDACIDDHLIIYPRQAL